MPMIASLATDDTLSDGVDWVVEVDLVNADTQAPLDLTGSELRCTFRSLLDGSLVLETGSAGSDAAIAILDPPTAGKVQITALYSAREWRAPVNAPIGLARTFTVVGDLIRRASAADPLRLEDEARILIKVRPSTTQWLPSP